MDFTIRHRFDVDARTLWDATEEPGFKELLAEHADVEREVLEDVPLENGRRLVVRIRPRRTLPPPAAAALGTDRFSYVQENLQDDRTMRVRWRVVPDVLADRIRAEGELVFQDTPEGCERVVTGRIEVAIPLVGRRIERHVVDGIRASWDQGAEAARKWLAIRAGRA